MKNLIAYQILTSEFVHKKDINFFSLLLTPCRAEYSIEILTKKTINIIARHPHKFMVYGTPRIDSCIPNLLKPQYPLIRQLIMAGATEQFIVETLVKYLEKILYNTPIARKFNTIRLMNG